ncbi:unnamed protein product [Calypogeia fissa]
MEQEDHADGQITETSEQISEFPPQAEMEQEERDIVAKLGDMEQEERDIGAKLGDMEQQAEVLNAQIKEISRKRQAAEGTLEDLKSEYITLLEQILQLQSALMKQRYQLRLDRIALKDQIAYEDESDNEHQVESAGSPQSPADDGDWCPPDESGADDDAVSRPQTRHF